MSKFKIYTRTGDKGESSLFNGERRPKTHDVFGALGDVDELNASIGLASELVRDEDADPNAVILPQLSEIQSRLLDAGSAIATPSDSSSERKKAIAAFDSEAAARLEGWIDHMDESLPQLTNFILPSGGKGAAALHVARATCRRAERAVHALPDGTVDESVKVYLNRLSDYLFTAARFAAKRGETVYKKARE